MYVFSLLIKKYTNVVYETQIHNSKLTMTKKPQSPYITLHKRNWKKWSYFGEASVLLITELYIGEYFYFSA